MPTRFGAKLLLVTVSLLFGLVCAEGMLRAYLFHAPKDVLGLRDANFYTHGQGDDDFWYYRYIWGERSIHDIGREAPPGPQDPSAEFQFYEHWPVSLQLDPVLGYVRRPGVSYPGHETSRLGTRSVHEYAADSRKIIFYGDSFVESNAPSSDTLTAKMERQSGIDCLNYGVGGYGLDQIYLLFERTYRQFDAGATRFLIGVIGEDLQRMLLTVRQGPKPYYTIENGVLRVQTDHIDARNPRAYFEQYRPPFRLFLGRLLIKRIPWLNDRFTAKRQREEDVRIRQLTRLLMQKFKGSGVSMVFVLFSDWRDGILKAELQYQNMPFIDLQAFMKEYAAMSGVPEPQLFPAGHPSRLFNDAIAAYILDRLNVPVKK